MLQTITAAFGLRRARPGRSIGMRKFEAAAINRLTESWTATQASIDQELRTDLDRLRRRSRDLSKNNEYMAKFVRMVRNNVIGQGMTLQSKPMDGTKLDGLAAQAIEGHFAEWAKPKNCDVAGRLGFWSMMRSVSDALCRDGEPLIRIRIGSRFGPYGIQLQLLDVERLETNLNRAATPGSNAIIMGVEVDGYRRPVAYHLRTALAGPTAASVTSGDLERVPANEVLHPFISLEPEQTRGVPWAHAAMRRLNDLGGYREAAIIAARIGAAKMGFYTSQDPDAVQDGTDESTGVPYTSVQAGEFGVLPPGTQFQTFDPTYPHEQFGEFVKAALRGISSGMGVSYNSLANDLEGVNFSSIRSGVLEERDEWMVLQDWWIEQILDPIFDRWLTLGLTSGAITQLGGSALPITKLAKFAQHTWQPRRWSWVDPLKDVQAKVLELQHHLTSHTDVAAANGRDLEDVLATIQREREMAAAYGIDLDATPDAPGADPASQDEAPPAKRSRRRSLADDDEVTDMLRMARRNQAAGGAVEFGLRMEPPPVPTPAPIVNVAAPIVNVAPADVTVVNQVQPAEVATEVHVEAVMPAPNLAVQVQVPPRRVDTAIQRDQSGRISGSTQIESDIA